MLDQSIGTLLNAQYEKELFLAYLYLDMANFYDNQTLGGFSNWFYVQAQRERDHALLIRHYLLASGEKIDSGAIPSPGKKYDSAKAPLDEALAQERAVTESIRNIYTVANEEKDLWTRQFLDWFVTEQIEEEKNMRALIERYDLLASDPNGLCQLNKELKARVYTPL
ncbi:ferritin [Oscillospiraceae bacterium OttesenSCG-928-G22]|nr:ferritin [Oscillospiraceae bacterium OttesenSCG-928-G22]